MNQTAASPLYTPFAVTLGLMAACILVENSLVFLVISSHRSMRTFTNGFIVSLAMSDFLVGCALIPGYIVNPFLSMNGYLTAIVLLVNTSSISAVTFERYLAVVKPLTYSVTMTKHFPKMIFLTWAVPVSISLLPLFWGPTDTLVQNFYLVAILVFNMVLPYTFIVFTYIVVFREVRRQVQAIAKYHVNRDQRLKLKGESRVTKVFAIIAGIFALAWLPVMYMTICHVTGRFDLIPMELSICSVYTLALNSMVNAPVYIILKRDFRKAFGDLMVKGGFHCMQSASGCGSEQSGSSNNERDLLPANEIPTTDNENSTMM